MCFAPDRDSPCLCSSVWAVFNLRRTLWLLNIVTAKNKIGNCVNFDTFIERCDRVVSSLASYSEDPGSSLSPETGYPVSGYSFFSSALLENAG